MTSRSKSAGARAREQARKRRQAECESWRKAVKQCNENIWRFRHMHSMHGQAWRDKMIAHWQQKKDELLANRPKGCR